MKKIISGFVLGMLVSAAVAQIAVETKTVRTARYEKALELVAGDFISVSGNKLPEQTFTIPSGRTARVIIRINAELE